MARIARSLKLCWQFHFCQQPPVGRAKKFWLIRCGTIVVVPGGNYTQDAPRKGCFEPLPGVEKRVNKRRTSLERLYHRYLENENTAAFVKGVSERYLMSTLARLASGGRPVLRRAATMAVGFLGDYSHNAILGQALSDHDRGVRLLADSGIRRLWRRDGNFQQQQKLARLCRHNQNGQFADVIRDATDLIEEAPCFAEAWNQRAVAHFARKQFEAAANDCHQTLELNAYHFGSAVGMAHCYLQLDEPFAALENFRRALALNPDLEDIRGHVDLLERTLEGK
jgi:tetratricopeptide (TPR) repeat protein